MDGSLLQFLPWLVWGGVIFWLWIKRQSWGRHALLGLGFFLLTLAPFTGFVNNHAMEASWANDHLLYIPLVGLIGLVVAGLGHIEGQLPAAARYAGIGMVALALSIMTYESESYAAVFADPEALWNYTLRINPEAWAARNSLGLLLLDKGNYAEAAAQFEQIILEHPELAPAHNNLANALKHIGRMDEAKDQCRQAFAIKPDYYEAHYNLATTLIQTGQISEAIKEFQIVLKINPDFLQVHFILGNLFLQGDRVPEAVDEYQQVIAASPNIDQVHNNLGVAFERLGRMSEARREFQRAVEINPAFDAARRNLLRLQNSQVIAPSGT